MLDQVRGHTALREVPQARNGLDDTVASERVGMRRGVGIDLREVSEHDGLLQLQRLMTDMCELSAYRLNL